MNREAGKGDKRVPEAEPGSYERGHEAIDWSAHREPETETQ